MIKNQAVFDYFICRRRMLYLKKFGHKMMMCYHWCRFIDLKKQININGEGATHIHPQ